jgi:hypothetical protein
MAPIREAAKALVEEEAFFAQLEFDGILPFLIDKISRSIVMAEVPGQNFVQMLQRNMGWGLTR